MGGMGAANICQTLVNARSASHISALRVGGLIAEVAGPRQQPRRTLWPALPIWTGETLTPRHCVYAGSLPSWPLVSVGLFKYIMDTYC